jgi:hypothetical protein
MTNLDTLRAIQDAINQSRWAEARSIVYRAIVAEQRRVAEQRNGSERPEPSTQPSK